MASINISHTFTPGTPAEAGEVNDNFDDVRTFLNTQAIHKDAAVFTVIPTVGSTLPSAITLADQLTNKAYVDAQKTAAENAVAKGLVVSGVDSTRRTNRTLSAAVATSLAVTFTNPGGRLYKITGQISAQQNTSGGNLEFYVYRGGNSLARISFDSAAAATIDQLFGFVVETPPSGSITYDLRLRTTAGTVDALNDIMPARIIVEDVGPA